MNQLDLLSITTDSLPLLTPGNWIRTSYGTGPYCITEVSGPCHCPRHNSVLPSELHYHITGRSADDGRDWYHLNGYRPDGTCVWSDDTIERIAPLEVTP